MRPWKGARDRMQPATGCSGSPASWAPTGAGPGGLGSDRGGQLEDGQVVACAGFQFGCRFRMGLKRLHLACDRARARTSWAGTASTRPERRSSNRWSASEAQALRISGSVSGSRLSTRRSARSARASLGRESAASAICSMEMPMAPAYSRAPVSTMWRLWRFTLAGRRKILRKTNPAAAGFGRGLQEPGAPGMRSWRSARDRGRACGPILAGHPQAGLLHRSAAARRAVS